MKIPVFIFLMLSGILSLNAAIIPIIPLPAEMHTKCGHFKINKKTNIYIPGDNAELKRLAAYFAEKVKLSGGPELKIISEPNLEMLAPKNAIIFKFNKLAGSRISESYELTINRHSIVLGADNGSGIFYGIQSLFQLMPAEIEKPASQNSLKNISLKCISIKDNPRYVYRGMHLDVCRHIFPVSFVKQYIDLMATYKMNTFHWHLTEDQGWRIEIKKYPKLASIGGFRRGTQVGKLDSADAKLYGGFYTQEQIKDIVAYAAQRYVTIIPEIEMPGHCIAALAAYPQLACNKGPFEVRTSWGVAEDVYCAGNDSVFTFLQDVLSEVIELFPSQYIHIGGDEVPKNRWQSCPKCQARIKTEGLKDEAELQSYFIKRIEKFLTSKGRKLIGWDEILEGGLAPEATVMAWRGLDRGIEAAKLKHFVIMTPGSHCYFDHYQADPAQEPLAIGGFTPLKKVYSFEPTPVGLNEEEAKYILGAQANLWTEYIDSPEQAAYMTYPRVLALSEVTWSPKSSRNWENFVIRIDDHFKRLTYKKVNYCKSLYDAEISTTPSKAKNTMLLALNSDWKKLNIRYTLDGTDPTAASPVYSEPVALQSETKIRAALFNKKDRKGRVVAETIYVNKAFGKQVQILTPYSKQYPGKGDQTLVDGMKGNLSVKAGAWLGYHGNDMEIIIDLGASTVINSIRASFLKSTWSWIFLPKRVEYYLSDDGITFAAAGIIENNNDNNHGALLKEFHQLTSGKSGRYIKVKAINVGVCPAWHGAAGQTCWLFADEIVVD